MLISEIIQTLPFSVKASRRLFLAGLFLSSCGVRQSIGREQLTIGTLTYGAGNQTSQYDGLKQYLSEKLQSIIQIEPTFNENKALERIKARAWSLVFAPPGLAAIAMSQYRYTPLIPLDGNSNLNSVLVVKKDSLYQDLKSLAGKKLAIGQPGSATGYYFPIYNFYGLILAELIPSATPKAVLEAVAQGRADVGALSLQEFNTHKTEISQTEFRVVFVDRHRVPAGAILVSPDIELKLQDSIHQVLQNTPALIARQAGFIPQGTVPDYKYMVSVVKRVRSILPTDRSQLTQKPIRLF
ncbi:phosphate/phosphite/phosphonate ABC transporter substrate-binding protein [Chamaesiphon sp.]|uniref:phosphate/phosphite/phosphonate ABC transporter substrate-binding protein n=1 Tax=Chamaesiphon sp. TaxID=2814140 RepID=UPI0035931C86